MYLLQARIFYRRASLTGMHLRRAYLKRASLERASFRRASLTDMHLLGAHILGAHLFACISWESIFLGVHLLQAGIFWARIS